MKSHTLPYSYKFPLQNYDRIHGKKSILTSGSKTLILLINFNGIDERAFNNLKLKHIQLNGNLNDFQMVPVSKYYWWFFAGSAENVKGKQLSLTELLKVNELKHEHYCAWSAECFFSAFSVLFYFRLRITAVFCFETMPLTTLTTHPTPVL